MILVESGISLSGSVDSEKIIRRADIITKFGFDYRPLVVERLRYWKALPEGYKLNFFDIATRHDGSSGLYLLEQIVGNNWVFLQAMLENGISTKHKHLPDVPELYDPFAGESMLNVNGVNYTLRTGEPFEVSSESIHQLRTDKYACLNLLIVKNSSHIPRNKLHIPAE